MKLLPFVLCLILVDAPAFALTGGEVGNGGDILQCRTENGSTSYSFDYYLARQWQTPSVRIIEARAADPRENLAAIADRLRLLDSGLSAELFEFASDLFRDPDYSRRHVWLKSTLTLNPIDDQNPESEVEPACMRPGTRLPQLFQAVVRNAKPKLITFHFNEPAFSSLKGKDTDLSFLLLHEWLWDYTTDARALRQLNFLLHSTRLQEMSPADFRKAWRALVDEKLLPPVSPTSCLIHRIDGSTTVSDEALSWNSCVDYYERVKNQGAAPLSLFLGSSQLLGRVSTAAIICRIELFNGSSFLPTFGSEEECRKFLAEQFKIQPSSSKPVRAHFKMERIY